MSIKDDIRKSLPSLDNRMAVVLRMEWAFLFLRYLVYVVLAVSILVVQDTASRRAFIIVGTSALLHNLLSHWIFYTRRHLFFVSLWNFLIYLAWLCVLVGVSGGSDSPFASIFVFFLIGYRIYNPQTADTFGVTVLVCAAYSFTVMADWLFHGISWFHLSVYFNLLLIAFTGWIMGILGRMLFVWERNARAKAAALESSEATLRAILNHTAHPILVYDEEELITDANASACNFLGYPREKILGMRFQTFLFDDGALARSLNILKKSGDLHQEMLVLPSSGTERNVYMHIHSFLGEGRRFFVALFHDITNQKELQDANRLAKLNLQRSNRELQRVIDLHATFYTNVANRLRSPLAAVVGFTDMLLEEQLGLLSEEQRKALQSCRRSLMRIFDQLEEVFLIEKQSDSEEDLACPLSEEDTGLRL